MNTENKKKPLSPKNYRRLIVFLIVANLILGCVAVYAISQRLASMPNKAHLGDAQFTISSWSYPYDEYGQGIQSFDVFENSTGVWLQVGERQYSYDSQVYNWTAGVAIQLYCWTLFNSTLAGATSLLDGQKYQRHNVTVTDSALNTVFSQENFTFFGDGFTEGNPMWYYDYVVILDFLPASGQSYTATVTYEVYY
jgi:hypothetical protein